MLLCFPRSVSPQSHTHPFLTQHNPPTQRPGRRDTYTASPQRMLQSSFHQTQYQRTLFLADVPANWQASEKKMIASGLTNFASQFNCPSFAEHRKPRAGSGTLWDFQSCSASIKFTVYFRLWRIYYKFSIGVGFSNCVSSSSDKAAHIRFRI